MQHELGSCKKRFIGIRIVRTLTPWAPLGKKRSGPSHRLGLAFVAPMMMTRTATPALRKLKMVDHRADSFTPTANTIVTKMVSKKAKKSTLV